MFCLVTGRLAQHRRPSVATLAKGKKGKGGGGDSDAAPSKGKGGKGGGKDTEDVDGDAIEKEAKTDAENRMKKAVQVMADTMNTLRTGRANPAILDRISVEYYGAMTPLKQVASITVPDSTTLSIAPFDPSAIKDIERAINESDLGINPMNDGEKIRLGLPQLTTERRKDLVKQVNKYSEEAKIAVRNVRKDVMKLIDKYGDAFAKDARKSLENEIQKLTDVYCKRVDELCKTKSDELMKV
ncbi:ribosome recycling factor-domain-containing protein [Dunaliella salina]|uniref:Ribosome-recycling factor, chloroplastic n=1 Tax=Dunaliella salina TaxID=3046 RepID=A0ABQ7GQM5_DUNSA|nr:ribosome recycling factor-domain-containing protein [Dunaliella salina]|eukprot:KAF5836907.1 ribosome recycling factor-domain-containing protein [Dunaliella salina]